MNKLAWEKLERRKVFGGEIYTVYRERSRCLEDGREHEFDILESVDWVNVVALTPAGNLLLVRQFRHGTGELTVEIPGGMIDHGETPEQAARRELSEETGYQAEHWEALGMVEPNPAFQTNRTYTFLARAAVPAGRQHLDENERIEVLEWPLGNVWRLVENGTIRHALVICALFHLLRHGDLALPILEGVA